MSAREHEWLQRGPYRQQYELELLPVNQEFVQHPYRPSYCKGEEVACFSVTDGMNKTCSKPCQQTYNQPVMGKSWSSYHYTPHGQLIKQRK